MPRAKATRHPADDPQEGPSPGGTEATVVTTAPASFDVDELQPQAEQIRDVPPEDEDEPEDDD